MMNLQSNIQKGLFSMTDAEIIEIIRAYALQKKYIEQLEEIIERYINGSNKHRRNKQIKKRK